MRSGTFLILAFFLNLTACVGVPSDKQKGEPNSLENKTKAEEKLKSENKNQLKETQKLEEKFVVEGWILNTHAEYFHTVIGFKTHDNKLLNIIFPGLHMQLTTGMHCRLTYHRVNDIDYLPEFVRKQKASYFYLDKVELLPDTSGGQSEPRSTTGSKPKRKETQK